MHISIWSFVTLAVYFGLPVLVVFAEDAADDWIYDPYEIRQQYYHSDEGRTAEELLNHDEFGAYRAALETEECDPAYAILANAYSRAYPSEPHPGENSDARAEWIAYILSQIYPELAFCLDLRKFLEAESRLKLRGREPRPFTDDIWDTRPEDFDEYDIEMAFRGLFNLARRRYPPVYLALAELSEKGEIFRFERTFHYYLLLRARIFGLESDDMEQLIQSAESRLEPDEIADIRQRAEAGLFGSPYPLFE